MGYYKNEQTTLLNIKPSDTIKGLHRTIERLESEIESLKTDLRDEKLKSLGIKNENK